MRTTIDVDDALLRRAKAAAAGSGRSLNDLIVDALRSALTPNDEELRGSGLPLFEGGGLQTGVDLAHSATLLDLMERGHE